MKPLWIVQNNLGSSGDYESMRDYANASGIPFMGVKIRPFTDDVPEDKDPTIPVVVYGSCGMIRAVSKTYLRRGVFGPTSRFEPEKWISKYKSLCLNYDSVFITAGAMLKSKLFTEDQIFVRGNDDDKTMAGHVTNGFDLRRRLFNNGIDADYKLVISPAKEIYSEYRCWIVDDEVVAVAKYKDIPCMVQLTKDDVKTFAKSCLRYYQPHNIFVMDVCYTDNGFKIVELNGFNSSGLYNTEGIPAIMNAINDSVYFGVKNFEKIA